METHPLPVDESEACRAESSQRLRGSALPASNSKRWNRLARLFEAALELPAAGRSSFLSEQCGPDLALLAEIEEMIDAHEGTHGLAIEDRLLEASSPPMRGKAVGQYRLLEPIGRGGMGEVFLAERADAQYQQQVAVKLLRPGFYGGEMVLRFERERQILARLEHPNIATLLDGGVAEDGRPFLVMQYVQGEAITEYCDRRRLGIEQRLRLFASVCRAVQFSHANLIVHRDLKPSNILVTDTGEPKLLDFGIAKLLDTETAGVDATRADLRVLTPKRAAPEQLLGEPVTAAVDVYALGILLCELLVGRGPHHFSSRDPQVIARTVDTRPPTSPSALLRAASGELDIDTELTAEMVSERRGCRLERLRRQLGGELDHMVLMALRREPERRYVSAAQFGEDVERYLAGEPVIAHADSWSYRTRKFLLRHRLGASAAALFTLLVLGFGVVTAVQNRSVAEQRDRANAERDRAEAVVQMLTGMFATADPVQDPGRDQIAVTELLERGEAGLDDLEEQPATRARMLLVLGQINAQRSRFDKAHGLLEQARDAYLQTANAPDPTSLAIDHQSALVIRRQGDHTQARRLLAESLAAHRGFYGTQHLKTAQAMGDLGVILPLTERRPLLEEALAIRRSLLDPQDPAIASSLDALASHHGRLGDLESARQLYREALAIMMAIEGEKHPHTVTVLSNLAGVLENSEEQIAAIQRVIELRQEILPESVDGALAWNNLGVAYRNTGRFAEARQALETSLELLIKLLGADHLEVANTLHNLGQVFEAEGHYEKALHHHETALELTRRGRGDSDFSTARLIAHRAHVLARLDRLTEALREIKKGIEILRRASPTPTTVLSINLVRLGRVLLATGSAPEAEAAYREAWTMGKAFWSPEHPRLAEAIAGLGQALAAQGQEDAARPLLIEAEARLAEWPLMDPLDLRQLRATLNQVDGRRATWTSTPSLP